MKTKGKAAVELVGRRLGRGLGGYIQQTFLLSSSSILTKSAYLKWITILFSTAWLILAKKAYSDYPRFFTSNERKKN